ncbi:unnamed protein product [Symbiodinium sp. CCMP2592]|nr:unnamed protein product [Symbiodinium sp. CCMP2592]CAE7490572.1 unnamed protein product [Symbiodinium sp. CCMP2592]
MMLPHILFSCIYSSYPATWKKSICPSVETLEQFWNAMLESKNPNVTSAITRKKNWKQRCIPLACHGDGVPVTGLGKTWVQTVTNFSWFSLLTTGSSTMDALFFIYSMYDKMRADAKDLSGTAHYVLQLLRWSFEILFKGVWPSADHFGQVYPEDSPQGRKAGKQIAGGFCGTLFSVVGDLDYYASVLDLPRSTSASSPCCRCQATKYGHLSWQNYHPNAPWKATVYSPSSWRGLPAAEKSTCPLFHMSSTSICNLGFDYMHCKYLGQDRKLYSSVLFLLVFYVLNLGSPEANMDWVWSQIQIHYRTFGTESRFLYLNKVSMFFRAKVRALGLRGKAAEVRSLAKPLFLIWASTMNHSVELHRKVHLLLKLNNKLEEILAENKFQFTLSAADAAAFRDSMNGFLLLQEQLSQHFSNSNHDPPLFSTTEKCHFLQHIALESRSINPRLLWCFSGEDFQRRVQRITAACARGQKPGQAEVKMCQRYRIALHLRFRKHEL